MKANRIISCFNGGGKTLSYLLPAFFAVVGMRPFAALSAFADGALVKLTSSDYLDSIIGVDGSWGNNGADKTKMFDGDTSSFFDPDSNTLSDCWAGVALKKPMVPTRVRYYGRADFGHRPRGCVVYGANTADRSDAVELARLDPWINVRGERWNGNSWLELPIPANTSAYTYLYIRSTGTDGKKEAYGCGCLGELEFYGYDTDGEAEGTLSAPVLSGMAAILNNTFSAIVSRPDADCDIEAQRRAKGGEWENVPKMFADQTSGQLQYTCIVASEAAYDFRFRSRSGKLASEWVNVVGDTVYYPALSGDWIGTSGSYNNTGTTGALAFNGNVNDFVDGPNKDPFWTGLDFGEEKTVYGVRFVPRPDQPSRMKNATFEISNNADFEDDRDNGRTNTVFYTVESSPSANVIAVVQLDEPLAGRYVRYSAPGESHGNVAEVEFYTGADDITDAPKSPSVAMDDNLSVTLSWSNAGVVSRYDEIVVYRSLYEGGPWTEVAQLAPATTTWNDATSTLKIGPTYYYALAYRSGSGDDVIEGPKTTDRISVLRLRQLERSPEDLTTLRVGVTAIHEGEYYDANNNHDTMPFDGNTGTFCDLSLTDGAVGVDLGESNPYAILACRVARRRDGDEGVRLRLDGAGLYGSNSLEGQDGRWPFANCLLVGGFTVQDDDYHFFVVPSENRNVLRYLYVTRLGQKFNGNVAELELYGCLPEDLDNVEFPDLIDTPTPRTVRSPGGGITVSWDASASSGATYDVLKMASGSGVWETLATGLTSTSYFDAAVENGFTYEYRVGVNAGGEYGVGTSSGPLFYYRAGTGTGLWARYGAPFTKGFSSNETPDYKYTVDPNIDFNWEYGALSPLTATDYVRVDWEGELEVPLSDTYNFRAESDDGFTIVIDGRDDVINNYGSGGIFDASLALSAGRHRVQVHFQENYGRQYCRLYWSTASLPREIIPATQFYTVANPLTAVPEPWVDARPFECDRHGVANFNPDGTLTLASPFGNGFAGNDDRIMFAWQDVKGDFDCRFRYARAEDGLANNNEKLMLMARFGLATGAPFAATILNLVDNAPDYNGYSVKYRPAQGGEIAEPSGGSYVRVTGKSGWLRLVRRGRTFMFYAKESLSDPWIAVGSYTFADGVEVPQTIQIGPAVAGRWNGNRQLRTFTVSNFEVRRPGLAVFVR